MTRRRTARATVRDGLKTRLDVQHLPEVAKGPSADPLCFDGGGRQASEEEITGNHYLVGGVHAQRLCDDFHASSLSDDGQSVKTPPWAVEAKISSAERLSCLPIRLDASSVAEVAMRITCICAVRTSTAQLQCTDIAEDPRRYARRFSGAARLAPLETLHCPLHLPERTCKRSADARRLCRCRRRITRSSTLRSVHLRRVGPARVAPSPIRQASRCARFACGASHGHAPSRQPTLAAR
jgi:hypothetical protein